MITQAAILVGGRGTRLGPLTTDIPKPLMEIGGIPVLEHQLQLLERYDIQEVWILAGYLSGKIETFLAQRSSHQLLIHLITEPYTRGTAGALKILQGKIQQDFLVMSGDIMANFDIQRYVNWHHTKSDALLSIVVHPSDHMFDSDLVSLDTEERVQELCLRPHDLDRWYHNQSNASVYILSPEFLHYIPTEGKQDIEKDVFPKVLADQKKIYAYSTPEYLKDIGTPSRLEKVRQDYASGKIERLSLSNPRKAVFLDRDGVLNPEVDQLSDIDDFELYLEAIEAIQWLNQNEYLAIVITNQPMVAKGFLSERQLEEIHKKMETILGRQGAWVDAIYYCPHHPEKGFVGERSELKIQCHCRKPGIDMIKKAQQRFNIDLNQSFLIGDSTVDYQTALNAGLKFLGVQTGYACKDRCYPIPENLPLSENILTALSNIGAWTCTT